MYMLVNKDKTINFAADHPIDNSLIFEGTTLIELPNKTLAEVVGNIKREHAAWDESTQTMIIHPLCVTQQTTN